ncbi:MAG: baseplate assembly protein [Alphaproteobacteria bacterium]|nr:MAG: baseplate assembly protein [Alphaproteobacteria bacterium]
MAGRSTIDLSRLPPPDAVQVLDFETYFAAVKAEVIAFDPSLAADMELESSIGAKLLQVFAFRELLLRNRANQSVRAVMPALATGADLDQLAVIVGIQRLVVNPGDPEQGITPTYEDDEAFRRRFTLAPDGFSVAGPAGAYEFHALSADGDVLDASATSPEPGQVLVTVLSRIDDGEASPALLALVEAGVSADDVRPLTDEVIVQSATIKPYSVQATLRTYAGPDPLVVMGAAEASLAEFIATNHRLGRDVNLSGLYHALHVPGVQRVDLAAPLANIVCDDTEAAFCTAVALTHGGLDE